MGQTLCALLAGLLMGQAQEITTIQTGPVQPACKNCGAAANSGWTQVQSSTQTRTWTQTGTWTPATGWTWQSSTSDSSNNTPVLNRFTDLVSTIINPKPANAKPAPGWQTTGKNDGAVQAKRQPSTGEPPLLDMAVQQPTIQLIPPAVLSPTAFQPAPVQSGPPLVSSHKIPDQQLNKIGHEDDYSSITGRVEIVNGAYFVHYANPEAEDHFGGRMILNGNLDLTVFHTGDLVTARGSVVPGRTISLYRVHYVELVER